MKMLIITTNTEEILHQHFPVILKLSLQNNKKILKKYFLSSTCIEASLGDSNPQLYISVFPIAKGLIHQTEAKSQDIYCNFTTGE